MIYGRRIIDATVKVKCRKTKHTSSTPIRVSGVTNSASSSEPHIQCLFAMRKVKRWLTWKTRAIVWLAALLLAIITMNGRIYFVSRIAPPTDAVCRAKGQQQYLLSWHVVTTHIRMDCVDADVKGKYESCSGQGRIVQRLQTPSLLCV